MAGMVINCMQAVVAHHPTLFSHLCLIGVDALNCQLAVILNALWPSADLFAET